MPKLRLKGNEMECVTCSAPCHKLPETEVVGIVQQGRAGLGWGTAPRMWSKASKTERNKLVISKVVREEKESYKMKAMSQS